MCFRDHCEDAGIGLPLQRRYNALMAHDPHPQPDDQRRDDLTRRALTTPPISNEDIVKRSKESRKK